MPKKKTSDRQSEIRAMRKVHSLESHMPSPFPDHPIKVTSPPTIPTVEKVKAVDPKKDKKLLALIEKLKKKYKGEEVLTTLANGSRSKNIAALPSGWQSMDDLMTGETDADARTIAGSGIGWPRGRIMEIYGAESVGKTTLCLHIIAAAQKAGELCAFVDAEHALDLSYASKLGVNKSTLMINQPDSGGERALDVVDQLACSGAFGVIVVDSVAALAPQAELDTDLEQNAQPGGHARLMSRMLRKLTSRVAKNNVLLVFINQTRKKIGVRFGNPNTTTGGEALKFYASIRLELTNMKTMRKGDRVIGRRTRVRTVKNKVAPPFRDLYVDVIPNKGFAQVYADPNLGGGSSDDDE